MTAMIVLAAGRSSRMGRAKALLPHADGVTTFVAHAIRTARAAGLTRILVVGREDDVALRQEVASEDAAFVVNKEPERGQLSSVLAGLDAAEQDGVPQAIMVTPVDVPLLTANALRVLLAAAATTAAPIVRAASEGRHGHPVIFKREMFAELRSAPLEEGARAVIRADVARVADIEVGDPGVLLDVDTPADYARAFPRLR